ncbi:MAG: serine hydrolase [Planctomycetes bacterium]|nr:serine hydrolase [Planctomycetota bacterium]
MRVRPFAVLAFGLAAACATTAPRPLAELATPLAERLAGFHGVVGVYVRDLTTGDELAVHADEPFPTASLIKLPLLAALFARIDAGEIDYHADLVYETRRRYPGEDLLGSFADGQKIALAKVVMLMLTMSDNTASLWCQELAGTGTAVNAFLAANGCTVTRVNSRTPGREAEQKRWGWGVTTPREMASLLVRIRDRQLVSPAASEEMARCLGRIFWDGEALAAIPPHVHTLSKQGAVNRSRSEVVLVHGPHGDYVFCVITKDQLDESWSHDNEGFVLLRDVSAMLWRHFAPGAAAAVAAAPRYR